MLRQTSFAFILFLASVAASHAAPLPASSMPGSPPLGPLPLGAPPPSSPPPGGALSPYVAVTAGDFAAGCKIDHSSCAAMVGEVLMNRVQFSPTSHICLPGVNYADGVASWLDTHAAAKTMRAHDGIYLAITTLYRCGAPNNY